MAADFYGKNLLITGATGQFGNTLARRLLKDGYRLKVLARSPQKLVQLTQKGAYVVKGDLTDPPSLQAAVNGCHFVFHVASAPNEPFPKSLFQQVNVDGTWALAEAAQKAGVERFIHVSCTAVYGTPPNGSLDEFAPLQYSRDPYIDSKVQAELILREMAKKSGLPLVIAQPSLIYGPGMETWTMHPLRSIGAGQFVLPDGGAGLLHPLYMEDAAEGVLAAALSGEVGQAYILCGPEVVSAAEFFGHYAQMLGIERVPTVSAAQALREATLAEWSAKLTGQPPKKTRTDVQKLMMRCACNGAKAYYDLQFAPRVQFEEGMRRIKIWLQEQVAQQKRAAAPI